MEHGKTDEEHIRGTRNVARFFTESRHIAWVLLFAVSLWGIYAYHGMPQRKDPDIPVRQALAMIPWPGASAERVEQLVTKPAEEAVAENATVERIESVSQTGASLLTITLTERIAETGKEFDDIKLKLDALQDLPQGAGPVQFVKDFGDTAALMLTLASPRVDDLEIEIRARGIRGAIDRARAGRGEPDRRLTLLVCFPGGLNPGVFLRYREAFLRLGLTGGLFEDCVPLEGPGFIGLDMLPSHDEETLSAFLLDFIEDRMSLQDLHPDIWHPLFIRDPSETLSRLERVAGMKYSYRELDRFTDLIKRHLQTVPQVSKVSRLGVLEERVVLEYSQERMAAYGIRPSALTDILSARNTTVPGGVLEVGARHLAISPTGAFRDEEEIGGVILGSSPEGTPVYLRDLAEIDRVYESPPGTLNFHTWRTPEGTWQRSRAITLSVQMRPGEQIGAFAAGVDGALADLRPHLPGDLLLARTSDQPRQVASSIDLFMQSLYEAIALVVIVALIGFREWRSALLMAASIPLTLAMTFGFMHLLGIDLQQVSIASLIIALGLLVDDPVVAGDAIKRDLAAGHPPAIAAWLGPTKLATAILFATITNIVAYLPLLTLKGDTRAFLFSLPVVLTASLVSSRLVSMTFIPLLGYYLLRPGKRPEPTIEERRSKGLAGAYYRLGSLALEHRWGVMAFSLLFLCLGAWFFVNLKSMFFPKDLSYLFYVDVWLPEGSTLGATLEVTEEAEAVIREVLADRKGAGPDDQGAPKKGLHTMTTFVGGGAPRFWFSVSPEQEQSHYAQILIEVEDSHATASFVEPLQAALSSRIAGARLDVRQLETGSAVGIPVQVRISGQDLEILRQAAWGVGAILSALPLADRVRDDWGEEGLVVRLQVDSDRANLAGISNADVAASSGVGISGYRVTTLREGDTQIPVIARLRMEERARLSDVGSLYVHSLQGPQKIPLSQVSTVGYALETGKIRRRNQFRTITVAAFPGAGTLASEVVAAARQKIEALAAALPPGYRLVIGGEEEEQSKGFKDLAIVMAISVGAIFLALVFQFRNAVKPLIVFAALPYGVVGSLAALWVMDTPFDFMAFLGIASLIGVIVSHIIVLFDFIEEMHAQGKPFEESVLDAGIARLRPVFITVGATVLGLVPLAMHGGPLWEPLCYTQIGGLLAANFITKLLVPAVYAICVKDLKIVKWEESGSSQGPCS